MGNNSKSIVLKLSQQMGLTVLELEDCSRWSMIDIPTHNVVGSTALISKDGRQYHVQFDSSRTKYAVDEM
ncbi:hypothetical protein ACRTEU_18130 [Vibrio alginolyticus]|uniref:hypothetical protein n=1 Tax=Vibrio alginolyticus TaxID=663 RepID=UPI003D7D3CAA